MHSKKIPLNGTHAKSAGNAQTLGKAVLLLKLVGSSRSRHLRLVDLAELAGLERSTAHRLLQRLVHEGMLTRENAGRGYRLGPLLHELGLDALPDNQFKEAAQPFLGQLTRITGDMAFLVMRRGYETVCLDRMLGNFAIQTLAVGVGDRHPVGVGAGGAAILAAMEDAELPIVIAAMERQLQRYGLTEAALRERVERTRKLGYALDEGLTVADVTALSRPVCNKLGVPIGAVTVASIKSRMTPKRRNIIDRALHDCVTRIGEAMS